MAKKKEETTVEAKETKETLAPLTQVFDKEDLNVLRDKINEIIAKQ